MTDATKKFLVVGLSCVDIIAICDGYPEEDSDHRSVDQIWQRGGNASNSSSVLALLGAHVECMVSIADSHEKMFILEDFQKFGIHYTHSVIHKNCKTPITLAIVNRRNGSRTLLHSNKNLPEIGLEDFKKVDLTKEKLSWIHFEARPGYENEACKMLEHINKHNESLSDSSQTITTSVELEKNRPDIGILLDKADYVFISKEYAMGRGCTNKEQTLHTFISKSKPGSTLICAWGEDGAAGMVNTSATNIPTAENSKTKVHKEEKSEEKSEQAEAFSLVSVPVYSPPQVIDTLGAGDTFNAATIFALSHDCHLKRALSFGCKVAGTKCGLQGYEGLKDFKFEF